MNLKYIQTLRQGQLGEERIHSINFSPNGEKLAVVTDERTLYLYDCKNDYELKDKFALKPANSKLNRREAFQVKQICFSPDSTKIAVAQTDEIIFVYSIGYNWGDKKSIIHKIETTSAVTALVWPREDVMYYWGFALGFLGSVTNFYFKFFS